MNSRRNFIKLFGYSTGAALWSACATGTKAPVIAGEEWKQPSIPERDMDGHYALSPQMLAEANASIDQYRTADFTIRLLKPDGTPLSGSPVALDLKQHHFDWGFSGARRIDALSVKDRRVTEYVKKLFNCTTAKCYWDERWHQPIEHQEGKRITERFRAEVDWALANGLKAKGHPLVWTVRKAIPRWMDPYPYSVQIQKLENHVRDLIRTGGKGVAMWDLCNEMLWEPSLRNLPQREWPHLESVDEILSYLEPAVHWAKEENPHAIYALNDYGLVRTKAPGVTSKQQRSRYMALVEEMHRRGCAPDAIGSQCHVIGWYSNKEFTAMLDDLSMAGLPIQITEFWAKTKDCPFTGDATQIRKIHTDYIKMIYTLAFAHPRVSHLTYWGGSEWFDKEGNPTYIYTSMLDLIKAKWSTHASLTTNADGEIALKAFFGDYHLVWRDGDGNQHPASISLNKGQPNIDLIV